MAEYQPRYNRVHKSLMEIKTIGGVEKQIAIANWTVCVAILMGTHVMSILPLSLGIHMVLRYFTKRDPFLRPAYLRYDRQGDVYDPWPRATQNYNHRPIGFGRGMLC